MGEGVTSALVEAAQIEGGIDVLDLASGEGDPALTLAALVGAQGTVTATDITPGPLEVAAARAREDGIRNIQFKVADAQQLPFEDARFDRVTCRFGAMFFLDPIAAMHETQRVLRPKGRVAMAVRIDRTTLFPGIRCASAAVRWWTCAGFWRTESIPIC
jgi:ubiquinone/menaquinone biosynthesis C-methylase UbiE